MARTANIVKPCVKQISLDEHTVAQVELRLFSETEGRVPYGAWRQLMTGLLQEWLKRPERVREFQGNLQRLESSNQHEYNIAQETNLLMKVELTKYGYKFD